MLMLAGVVLGVLTVAGFMGFGGWVLASRKERREISKDRETVKDRELAFFESSVFDRVYSIRHPVNGAKHSVSGRELPHRLVVWAAAHGHASGGGFNVSKLPNTGDSRLGMVLFVDHEDAGKKRRKIVMADDAEKYINSVMF